MIVDFASHTRLDFGPEELQPGNIFCGCCFLPKHLTKTHKQLERRIVRFEALGRDGYLNCVVRFCPALNNTFPLE